MAGRPKTPTQRGHETNATPSVARGPELPIEEAATSVYDSAKLRRAAPAPAFEVKSMRSPAELEARTLAAAPGTEAQPRRSRPKVRLRAMSEVASQPNTPQESLGYLAPPRNPVDVRARKTRDFIVWGSVCVILACFVALGIWFIAK